MFRHCVKQCRTKVSTKKDPSWQTPACSSCEGFRDPAVPYSFCQDTQKFSELLFQCFFCAAHLWLGCTSKLQPSSRARRTLFIAKWRKTVRNARFNHLSLLLPFAFCNGFRVHGARQLGNAALSQATLFEGAGRHEILPKHIEIPHWCFTNKSYLHSCPSKNPDICICNCQFPRSKIFVTTNIFWIWVVQMLRGRPTGRQPAGTQCRTRLTQRTSGNSPMYNVVSKSLTKNAFQNGPCATPFCFSLCATAW